MRRKVGSGDGLWSMAWMNYVNGFGSTETYFWLGLERIYQLTVNGKWRLRLEYQFKSNQQWLSAEYWTFNVGDNATSYVINVDGYTHFCWKFTISKASLNYPDTLTFLLLLFCSY